MSVYVFLGPTLPAAEARKELDAVYLPPASQGDVYRAAAKGARAIGIIDGYFDRMPAVWHKEILWAMAQGLPVYGSASMGALRAAELAAFGMEGVGRIFEAYRGGALEDDDEVAVVHGPAESGYRAASEAMVNLRATLAAATDAGIISNGTRAALEGIAKGLFYPERSYPQVLRQAEERGLLAGELGALRRWLPKGRVDQKRADALAMLQTMREQLQSNSKPKPVPYVVEHTVYWDRALQSAGVLATDKGGADTVLSRALLEELQLDARAWARAGREVLLHDLMLREAGRLGFRADAEEIKETADQFRRERGLLAPKKFEQWLEKHQFSRQQFEDLMRERALLRRVRPRLKQRAEQRLLDYLRLSGQYERLLARARDKARTLEAFGPHGPRLDEAGVRAEALLHRYLKSLGCPTEKNLEEYAAALGFVLEDSDALVRALFREHSYLGLKKRGRRKKTGRKRSR
ncbi:MAG: TfuA-like protein [Terriglobia bacterium]